MSAAALIRSNSPKPDEKSVSMKYKPMGSRRHSRTPSWQWSFLPLKTSFGWIPKSITWGIRVDGLESRIDALESGIDAKIGPLEAWMTDKMWNPWVSASPLARLRLRPMNHNPALVKDR
uniref:Uncharacterized protein n=1 Tax=Candidatus Kentrum sp. SD TaxID=2126332 RepID=A0A450Y4H0_9GAMM|nr:MAG: hypothetical protein BECKSD772F_GA0070984_100193 [Candidatus Kentron sp. SD]VFK38716.1 MAG: hypothetical protein BECKSD772E_GA0070983_100192 [Candidatus Kentron sp. SD]